MRTTDLIGGLSWGSTASPRGADRTVSQFRIIHRHAPQECGESLASWRGFASPLRGRPAIASCAFGRHQVWWDVEAVDVAEALTWLPEFVRIRIDVQRVAGLALP